jgi:hypothetical protein
MIGSNCPPSDFDLGLGVGLLALEVAPVQKDIPLTRCTSMTATLALGNGLWQGKIDETLALISPLKAKAAKNFCQYLENHRHRIVNYEYYQAEDICSIGSGAVESTIKQIDRRLKPSFRTSRM